MVGVRRLVTLQVCYVAPHSFWIEQLRAGRTVLTTSLLGQTASRYIVVSALLFGTPPIIEMENHAFREVHGASSFRLKGAKYSSASRLSHPSGRHLEHTMDLTRASALLCLRIHQTSTGEVLSLRLNHGNTMGECSSSVQNNDDKPQSARAMKI